MATLANKTLRGAHILNARTCAITSSLCPKIKVRAILHHPHILEANPIIKTKPENKKALSKRQGFLSFREN
jgi:hypothetical protein